jgi:uncharacterized membrane protein YphA (DoxX/SURF4 family)
MKSLSFVLRLLLGGLLLYSGLAKFKLPYEFLAAVNAYAITPPFISVLIAGLLPLLEIVLGVCLIGGVLTEGATILTVVLCAFFTVATSSAWMRGLQINCGCFGGAAEKISGFLVVRSAAFLALALLSCAFTVRFDWIVGAFGRGLRAWHWPAGSRRSPEPSQRSHRAGTALVIPETATLSS